MSAAGHLSFFRVNASKGSTLYSILKQCAKSQKGSAHKWAYAADPVFLPQDNAIIAASALCSVNTRCTYT